jgi:hypothetical protein
MAAAFISMLAYCTLLMRPDISADHLQECVKGASGWILTFLADIPDAGVDEEKISVMSEADAEDYQPQLQLDFDPFEKIDPKKVN